MKEDREEKKKKENSLKMFNYRLNKFQCIYSVLYSAAIDNDDENLSLLKSKNVHGIKIVGL